MKTIKTRDKLADVAVKVAADRGIKSLWYGNPELCQDIYDEWGGSHTHPLNSIATVMSAVARSSKWEQAGYINHMGRNYPVYQLAASGEGE